MVPSALIVVDLQNDYCHSDGKCYGEGRRLIDRARLLERTRALLKAAREVGHLVVYCQMASRTNESCQGAWGERRSKQGMVDVCLEGTWGHDFLSEVAPAEGDIVVPKRRFSGFVGTDLDLLLRSRKIVDYYMCGVATNGCVDLTLRDAFQRDYRTFGVADACDAYDRSLHDAALKNWSRSYGEVLDTDAVIASWS